MRNKNDKDLRKQLFLNLFFMLLPSSKARRKFIIKHKLFDAFGENVLWQPHRLPMDAKLIRIHNNVKIANDVVFITHDVLYDMFNHLHDGDDINEEEKREYHQNIGCIEIMDHVCIGYGATIMPNVKIGPRSVVAAGSVVTKDVPEGVVVAGNPAKVIGSFDDLKKKHEEISDRIMIDDRFDDRRIRQAWDEFEEKHAKRDPLGK